MKRSLRTLSETLLLTLLAIFSLSACEDDEEEEVDEGIVIGDEEGDGDAAARVIRGRLPADNVGCEIDVEVGTWYGDCSDDALDAAFR